MERGSSSLPVGELAQEGLSDGEECDTAACGPPSVFGSPVVAGETVDVVGEGIYTLATTNGTGRWTVWGSQAEGSSPAVVDGIVYVISSYDSVYAITDAQLESSPCEELAGAWVIALHAVSILRIQHACSDSICIGRVTSCSIQGAYLAREPSARGARQ